MELTELFSSVRQAGSGFAADIPEDWMQGRASYGGLVAALGLRAARLNVPDLAMLRSLQIAFIGPASDTIRIETDVLRQGRSVTFVEARMSSADRPAARALMAFGAARQSQAEHQALPMPNVSSANELTTEELQPPFPNFLGQFEVRRATQTLPFTNDPSGEFLWWVRHRDEAARTSEAGLVCMADVLPPAVGTFLPGMAPMSSLNWHLDLRGDVEADPSGWHPFSSRSEVAGQGYGSQTMAAWRQDGEPVLTGRQLTTVFG